MSISAQDRGRTEYEVKAAYLYSFGRFVEWPGRSRPGDADAFTVCVLGMDPFGAVLDTTLTGATARGRTIVLRRVERPEEARACQVLFISASEDRRLADTLQTLGDAAILTVSDMPEFTAHGGMIQFVTTNDRIRFEINLSAARKAGLTLSSDLLRVATAVRQEGQPWK